MLFAVRQSLLLNNAGLAGSVAPAPASRDLPALSAAPNKHQSPQEHHAHPS